MVTNDGFDWLYGEEADGSVVQEPPAIGAVTETGSPGAVASEPPASYLAEPPAEAPMEAHAEEAEAPVEAEYHVETAPEAPEFQTEEPVYEAFETAPESVEGFDSFDSFDEPVTAVEPPPPPPPVQGPVAPEPPAPPVAEVAEDFVDFDFGELDASFDTAPIAEPVETAGTEVSSQPAVTYPPPTPPSTGREEETVVMEAVAGGGTAEIPVLSSRGDIIPAGPRKLGLREKLMPAPRAPKAKRSTKTDAQPAANSTAASAPSGGAKKAIVSVVILAVSVAGVVWRSEGLKKMVFGNGAPSEAQVDAAFTPLNGYPYVEPPAQLMDQMNQMTEDFMPEEVEHYDMRLLGTPQKPQGMVMIFSVDPDLASPDQWKVELDSLGTQPVTAGAKEIRVGGVEAITVPAPAPLNSSMIVFADSDGFYFFAVGPNAQASEDIAKQLAKANS